MLSDTLSRRLFKPKPYDFLFNPVYLVRRPVYKLLRSLGPTFTGKLLDYGCGSMPYSELFTQVENYVGIDLADSNHGLSRPNLYFQNGRIPKGQDGFDLVVMFEVLDDLYHPEENLADIKNALKPGGHLILTSSFVWEIHEPPHDYLRYTPFGLKALLEDSGFIIEDLHTLGNHVGVSFQMLIMGLYEPAIHRGKFLAILTWPLVLTLNSMAILMGAASIHSARMYHTNFVICRKPI